MNKPLIGAGALIAILLGVLVALGAFAADPIALDTESPTNFLQEGTLRFESTGTGQDTGVLEYAKNGTTTRSKLIMDPLSICAGANGSVACIAMSVQFSIPFDGKRAVVEGNLHPNGDLLVRKLRVLSDGETPLLHDPGRTFISWSQAVDLIRDCSVDMIMQTHSLDVRLTLKDGREVVAVEPMIDDVFKIHAETSGRCGSIPLATE